MRSSDGLFKLIKSLKSREKAIFRHIAGSRTEDPVYLKLFDRFEKSGSFDVLNENNVMNELKFDSRNNFSVTKNYLFELILKCLSSAQAETSLDDVLRNRILGIKLLYEKTLFSKAHELLKKAKKACGDSENYLRLLEILKWEKNLVIEGVVKGNKESLLVTLSEEEEHALKCIGNISSYRLLSFRFNSLIKDSRHKSRKEFESAIKKFQELGSLKNEKNAITLASLITLLEISASINQLLDKPMDVYKYRKRMITLLDNKPVFLKENLTNYVITLYNLTNTCFALDYLNETETYITRLKEVTDKYSASLKQNTGMLISIGLYRLETGLNIIRGEYNRASENSIKLSQLVKKYENILTEREKAESLLVSIEGLFLNRDCDDSLKLIAIVNSYNSENIDPETLLKIKLIQILILHEKGNYETADYQAVSLQRTIKKLETAGYGDIREFETLKRVLAGLRKIQSVPELTEFVKTFSEGQKPGKTNTIDKLLMYWMRSRV
ncbi:MAG: hypothetical protein ABI543_02420 [Ignavibacteria bacterium]